MEDASDGGGRWGLLAFAFEVPGNREGACIQAIGGELLPEFDDAVTDVFWGGCGVRLWASGSRFERFEAALSVLSEESVEVSA